MLSHDRRWRCFPRAEAARRRGWRGPCPSGEVLEARLLLSAEAIAHYDFNGDTFSDVVEIKNNGEVWVGLSGSNSFLAGSGLWFDGVDASAFAHVDFADFNGDLRDDLVVVDLNGVVSVGLSTGTSFMVQAAPWADWAPASSFAHFEVARLNNDALHDFVAMDTSGNWWVAFSNGSSFVTQAAIWADWAGESVWADIEIGDFSGDGIDEIAGMDVSGNWWVGISDGLTEFNTTRWADWAGESAWAEILVGDFDNDGSDDVAGVDTGGNAWVGLSTPLPDPFFMTSLWADWAPASAWFEFLVGDFDGVNGDDLAGVDSSGNVWVALANVAGTAFVTEPNIWLQLGGLPDLVDAQVLRTNDALPGAFDLAGFDVNGDWRVAHSNAADAFALDAAVWADWDPAAAWASLDEDDDLELGVELDRIG